MSISIDFKNVIKRYGDNTVIPGLSLNIKKGEFFTLLGPSGCGKTTLLRMVAGFNSIEGGEIYFNDRLINNVSPKDRNIGMVFQNYAIFPHLTVKKNIAFGLENRKLPKDQIDKKVDDILKVVKIYEFKDRLPENLSGGQQQRVALARAIVIHPDVLLMDEPLSNLDAKLRIEMRNAIKDIQRDIGITTIYVTHDQEEAMAISDRIAVMNSGVIQHVGTPQNIYQRPSNVFVATFIGRTNILEGKLIVQNEEIILEFDNDYKVTMDNLNITPDEGKEIPVKISVRPEEFIIDKNGLGIKAKIVSSMFLGLNTHYFVELESRDRVEIIQESTIGEILEPGIEIGLRVKKEKINVFDKESELNITEGVVNHVS
ncbi:ABC transporter ATP-binding protein [Clostridium sp. Cult2]|uniref:ABC transporter ATP-binding protein n=1 Tax=Clostridium sp. Cult2 TaxID=2079003 RepID=UPI001F4205A2|nr:ABC transporter ATP-binding protein [Clostridium sp. Cult2]MCF6464369.1 polyamine ABC transporter ATP-binding protein [Clostridium sp. Cult2]